MRSYSYWDYLWGTIILFGGSAIILIVTIALALYVHWALAILWLVLALAPFTAFILRATDDFKWSDYG